MGNTYVNYTLQGPSQQAVAAALTGRSAIVSPAKNGFVVVFDEESEQQSDNISELGANLSKVLRCPVLAVFVYDDDILYYHLFKNGELIDEYDSAPDAFNEDADPDKPTAPSGGDAQKLCEAFNVQKAGEVERILRTGSIITGGYDFEIFRHEALCKTLGLPEFAVAAGYGYISRGEVPAGLEAKDLVRVK
jgi:hypothetical protein